jgi:ElaB/YqjD/DUF883 family membrane-anchored ribosome-binding protein
MTEFNQEISDDLEQAFGDDIDRLNRDQADITHLQDELGQMMNSLVALETYGSNPASLQLLRNAGWLAGTSMDAIALESFSHDTPDGVESAMATEALASTIAATLDRWSARILSFVKNMLGKVTDMFSSLWTKISTLGQQLTSKAWDATKAAGRTIKAHPYATVMAALVAAAAVTGVVSYVVTGTPVPRAGQEAMKAFLSKVKTMVGAIKSPFCSVSADLVKDGNGIVYDMDKVEALAKLNNTPAKLGWTQSAVKSVLNKAGMIWSELKTSLGKMGGKIISCLKFVDAVGGDMPEVAKNTVKEHTGSGIAGWATKEIVGKIYGFMIWAVIGLVYKLLKDVGLKAYTVVAETLGVLKPEVQAQTA